MAKPAGKVRAEQYRNYIGGEWVAPATGEYIENRNPADWRDLVGMFPASTGSLRRQSCRTNTPCARASP